MTNDSPSAEDLRTLQDGSIFEQLTIIKKFSRMQSLEVLHPLLDVLTQGREEIINAVADALVELKFVNCELLLTEITHHNCFVRWSIALAIQRIGDPLYIQDLIPAIGLGYEPTINVILQTLSQLDPNRFPEPNLSTVLKKLNNSEKENLGRNAIHQLGTGAFDTTENLLAIKILINLQWDRVIVPLIKASHHPDYRIRTEIATHLEHFSGDLILKECSRIIQDGTNGNLELDFNLPDSEKYSPYYYAIEGLGYCNTPEAHKIVIKLLHNGTSNEKLFAISALEHYAQIQNQSLDFHREIQKEMQNLLRISDRSSRKSLILALAKGKGEWIISAITNYVQDDYPEIRTAVAHALMQMEDNSIFKRIIDKIAFLLIDEVQTVRRAMISVFWQFDRTLYGGLNEGDIILKLPEPLKSKLIERMNQGLTTKSAKYREFAAFWLGIFRYPPAYTGLIQNFHHPDENVVVTNIVALWNVWE